MRLLRIDLERFGPFTDRHVTLRPDARLHVVYGPNEAGKSCALAAVTDLLFGFEHKTSYDFVHRQDELRIGAEIAARDGRRLAFRRRKGRKATLSTPEGGELGDDALVPFLGGIDRDLFCRAFGLSTETLRLGGREMELAKDDSGAQMLAAGTGLGGIPQLRKALEAEADRIFAPRAAQSRRFYQVLERHDTARKTMREQEFRTGDLKALTDEIARLGAELDRVAAARKRLGTERARLDRLRRVAPLVAELDRLAAGRAAFDDLPQVAPGFPARLTQALGARTAAEAERARAAAEAAEAAEALAGLTVDAGLLARAGDVARLAEAAGAARHARADRPAAEAALASAETRLVNAAAALGLDGPEALAAARPTDAVLAEARRLAAEGRRLATAIEGLEAEIARETAGLERLARPAEGAAETVDPSALQARRAAFAPVLRRLEEAAATEARLGAERRALDAEAARLQPAVADLAAMATRPRPAAATRARFAAEIDGLAEAIRRARDAVSSAAADLAAAAARLAGLDAAGPVPTPERIATARATRDQHWTALRATLWGEAGAMAGGDLARAVAGFETAAAEADRLADAALVDAERVARHGVETRLRDEASKRLEAARAALGDLDRRWRALHDDWTAAWSEAGIAPLPPAEMNGWSDRLDGLVDRLGRLDGEAAGLAMTTAAIEAAMPPLRALAREAGVEEAETLPAALLVERLDRRLADLAAAWDSRREARSRIRAAEERRDERRREREIREAERETWRAAFAGVLPVLGLAQTSSPEAVEAALAVWADLPGHLAARDEAEARLDRADRAVRAFETEAGALVATTAPDLARHPAEAAASELERRLKLAHGAEASRRAGTERVERASRSVDKAEVMLDAAAASLSALAAAADLPDLADLDDLARRLADREALSEKIDTERQRLATQADGADEATLRAELAGFDRDAATSLLQDLAAEMDRLDAEVPQLAGQKRDRERELELRSGGTGAERAAQERRAAAVELREAAREWAVLKAASLMLAAAVERHRAGRQDPIAIRAGDLFGRLTGGAFTGLGQDWGDDDEPRLVALRAGGGRVGAGGMSEGTRDQLYLALRLAHLEDFATRAEPAPFLADDLFSTFDDARTEAGLAVLAEVGATLQPILFTHHRHVVDLAVGRLGGAVDVIDLAAP